MKSFRDRSGRSVGWCTVILRRLSELYGEIVLLLGLVGDEEVEFACVSWRLASCSCRVRTVLKLKLADHKRMKKIKIKADACCQTVIFTSTCSQNHRWSLLFGPI